MSIAVISIGQVSKEKQNIEKLCGCFKVEFKYAETFSADPNYKIEHKEDVSVGTELVFPLETSDKRIVLQHLLVINDETIVKHWREDWTYEDSVIWKYQGNNIWKKEILKPEQYKGRWTQSVWEVSDAPRYGGVSEWVTTDGKTFWENTADAPLPRREYTTRNDYDVLRRTNRIILTDSGWIHDQYNQKIIRTAGARDKLLVEEKGLNTYVKKNNTSCAPAVAYWEKNKEYWTKVRQSWDAYVSTQSIISLKTEFNGKPLHEYLNNLAKEFSKGKVTSKDVDVAVKKHLADFINQNATAKTADQP